MSDQVYGEGRGFLLGFHPPGRPDSEYRDSTARYAAVQQLDFDELYGIRRTTKQKSIRRQAITVGRRVSLNVGEGVAVRKLVRCLEILASGMVSGVFAVPL